MTTTEQIFKVVSRYAAGAGLLDRDTAEAQLRVIVERSGKPLEAVVFDLAREVIEARKQRAD